MSNYQSKMIDAFALTGILSAILGFGRGLSGLPVPSHAFLWPPIAFFSLAALGSVYRAHRSR